MTHEGILAEYAATYPLALAKQQRLRAANPLSKVEIKPAYGLGYDVVVSLERCTAVVGGPLHVSGYHCGEPAVVVSADGEQARCAGCLDWESQVPGKRGPIAIIN